jgi:glycosyltransferase involved in cell wall biosynthesis
MLVKGLVSTIIPVNNRPSLVKEAVASVIGQTYRPIEVVIVDDGSTDQTSLEVRKLAEHYSEVRSVYRENGGPGAARESGRLVARGEFIQYLDSDDILLPRKFELQVAGLRENPDCDVAYGKTRFYKYGDAPSDMAWKRTGERIPTMFPSFLRGRWWDTSTPLYRRETTDVVGPWVDLRTEEDWEYDCRVARSCGRLYYCDEFVSDTRAHSSDQLSSGGSSNPFKLRDRAAAHSLILKHALAAEISRGAPEMQHFARELFLLARQCGAAGLSMQARQLFAIAQQASEVRRARGIDFILYGAGARLLGWRIMGRISSSLDMLR